jgi:hypothetical protein
MDKSFNDQELSDIMKEIEALEDDFQKHEEVKVEAPPVAEVKAHVQEAPEPSPKKQAEVVPMNPVSTSKKSSGGQTNMSFKVSGELNLELQFDVAGKIVSLFVNEQGLSIQMENGMTFSIPLKKTA